MAKYELRTLVDQIDFRDWEFLVEEDYPHFFLSAVFWADDADTDCLVPQQTRRWVLDDLSEDGIVKTALLCVLTAVEHEAREDFYFRGERVFGPHQAVTA
ncbi:MAG: hypothetical protein AB7Q01_08475 [Gammaproteobacteria bacterium]